jgi:hypothetical protein
MNARWLRKKQNDVCSVHGHMDLACVDNSHCAKTEEPCCSKTARVSNESQRPRGRYCRYSTDMS